MGSENATARLRDTLRRAEAWRSERLPPDTDAWRVVDGAADGFPGMTIDTFAGHWLAETAGEALPDGLIEACDGLCRSLWWKRRAVEQKEAPVRICGEEPPMPLVVQESGLRFLVDLTAGYSQGIFLDQRLNRAETRARIRPGDRLFNGFAYTCAFSVAAAAGGAVATSVDLSAAYLEWGRRNFVANGLDPEGHHFCRGDTETWLRRFARQGRRFRGVILDPPTFSRGPRKGSVFRVEKDFGALVGAALGVLEPGGWIFCSTNHRGLEAGRFRADLERACREHGRPPRRVAARAMPADFRGAPYLKAVWLDWGTGPEAGAGRSGYSDGGGVDRTRR